MRSADDLSIARLDPPAVLTIIAVEELDVGTGLLVVDGEEVGGEKGDEDQEVVFGGASLGEAFRGAVDHIAVGIEYAPVGVVVIAGEKFD